MVIPIIAGIIVAIATYVFLFGFLFPNEGDFKEAVYYWFKPDFLSLMKGECYKDMNYTFQLSVWLISGALTGVATVAFLCEIMGDKFCG